MDTNRALKVAIASGKGGTGKTCLSVNLAHYASARSRTLLLDLDVEEPNSAHFWRSEPWKRQRVDRYVPVWNAELCTACGRCVGDCAYHALVNLAGRIIVMPGLCHSCYACSELCPAGALPMEASGLGSLSYYREDALDFVEARLDLGLEQASPLIKRCIDACEDRLQDSDYKFRDCPPGTSCPLLAATGDVDYVILVTEPSPFGLNDLQLAVETMRLLQKPMGVVINRDSAENGALLDYVESENLPLLARIAQDRSIAELYSRGELIYPSHQAFREALDLILAELEALRRSS